MYHSFYFLLRKALPLWLLTVACTHPGKQPVTVLTLGRLRITNYEVQKDLQRQHKKEFNEQDREELLDRYVVIAEALQLRYDTAKSFQEAERHVADYLMVQPHGPLWNKNMESQARQYAQINQEKLEKRGQLFHFDIVRSEKRQAIIDALGGDSLIRDANDFAKIKAACGSKTGIETSYQTLQWPFLSYFGLSDSLFARKEGTVSPLWFHKGYYYCFYLDRMETVIPNEEDQAILEKELYEFKGRLLDAELDKELIAQGNPQVNGIWVEQLYNHLQKGGTLSNYNGTEWVIRSSIQGNPVEVSYPELMAPYHYLPMPGKITTREQIEQMAIQGYFNRALCQNARQLGLYDDPYFLLDMNILRNNGLFDHYMEQEIVSQCQIPSDAVFQYYQDSIQQFKHSRYLITDAYFFNTDAEAQDNWFRMDDFYQTNNPDIRIPEHLLNNLAYILTDYKLDKQELGNLFQKDDWYKIENLQPGHVSYSVAFKGHYVLFVDKEEEGSYTKSFNEVQDNIHDNLRSELISRMVKERMAILRAKYATELKGVNLFEGVVL